MKSNYKSIGEYIQETDIRNNALHDYPLMGLSVSKEFIPSIANIIGTDMKPYKIVKKNQFTYIADTSRRGDKIAISLSQQFDHILVSQIYTTFEIKDEKELNPEYLMMWFRRPEFDRYARFKSHGSAREIFDWDELCETLIPVPSIAAQRAIVAEYNAIQNRININQEIIVKLEQTAQAIYKERFVENVDLENLPDGWKIVTLKSICSKIGSGATPKGGKESYYNSGISLIRSTNVFDYSFSLNDLAFIDEKQAKALNVVEVQEKDILLNITGVSVARCCMVPRFILPARVNQHVMIIRLDKENNFPYYLLCLLCYADNKAKLLGISQSGSTREAITKSEIEDFAILKPSNDIIDRFEKYVAKIFDYKTLLVQETQKLNELKTLLLSKLASEG